MRGASTIWTAVLVIAAVGRSAADEGDTRWSARGFVGHKTLDYDGWGPLHEQSSYGLVGAVGPRCWPYTVAVDVYYSRGDAVIGLGEDALDLAGDTLEVATGIRRRYRAGRFSMELGVGMGVHRASMKRTVGGQTATSSDLAVGTWWAVGFAVRLVGPVEWGWSLRYARAQAELCEDTGCRPVGAGGLQIGMLLGVGF